jgi:creatinine amidohydrolase
MDRAVTDYPEFPLDFSCSPYRWIEFSKYGVMGVCVCRNERKGEAFLKAELTPMIEKVKYVLANNLNGYE